MVPSVLGPTLLDYRSSPSSREHVSVPSRPQPPGHLHLDLGPAGTLQNVPSTIKVHFFNYLFDYIFLPIYPGFTSPLPSERAGAETAWTVQVAE